jgi:hypothetical protein
MSQEVIHRDPPGQPYWSCTGRCAGRPMFGPWGACGCGGGISDHTPAARRPRVPAGWCGWEFRRCLCCPAWEERRADEDPTEPVTRYGGERGGSVR